MDTKTQPSAGPLHSLRSLGDSLLAMGKDRLDLLILEYQEEKQRLIVTVIWVSAGLVFAFLALSFASLTLVYVLWDSTRGAVLGGLSALYSSLLVGCVWKGRRILLGAPRPFAATRGELEKDRACLS